MFKFNSSSIFDVTDWEYAAKYGTDLKKFKETYGEDFNELKGNLEEQIDKKIEYWFQPTDPSEDSNWIPKKHIKTYAICVGFYMQFCYFILRMIGQMIALIVLPIAAVINCVRENVIFATSIC